MSLSSNTVFTMALYPIDSVVFAARDIRSPAIGDNPEQVHARKGDRLYVLGYEKGAEYPYRVGHSLETQQAFWVSSLELMGQKPF